MHDDAMQQDKNIGQGEVYRRRVLRKNHKIHLKHTELKMPVSHRSGSIH